MKTRVKHRSVLAALLSALCIVISAIIAIAVLTLPNKTAVADETADNAHGYYYSQLKNSRLAERLYNALWDMYEKGYFEKCTEQYDLTAVLTQAELGDYIIRKSPAIPVALGAARDAFYLDHPELFYVSVHDMRFIFGSNGTEHQAYLGAGKAENYYEEFTVASAEEVRAAVADFDAQLDKAVTAAKKDNADIVGQIKNANEYICNLAEYDFGAYDDKHGGLAYNGYVNTAYGILNSQDGKAGKALCEGYAKAFKVIMDKLGIPCVLVSGPACNGIDGVDSKGNKLEATYEPHMWNAVKVDGQWYGVDVCWNDTENNHDKYTLVGELSLMKNRYEDPVISSSEFKVRYPVLRALDYGEFTDSEGFEFKDSGSVDGQELGYDSGLAGISYEDKNFKQLQADGKYLAVRLGEDMEWMSYSSINEFMAPNMQTELVAGKYTLFLPAFAEVASQFAIMDTAPDSTTEFGAMTVGTWINAPAHILAVSAKYNNQDFGLAKGKPHIKSMTPNEPGYIMSFEPANISITYDEPLIYADTTTTEVDIDVTAERSDIKNRIKVENVVWHEDTNTVTFTFTPSKMYSHNGLAYYLTPTNLIGKESGEVPEAGRFAFRKANTAVICPKIFNDGRLFIKISGEPKFVSASDESLNRFTDKNGQPIVNQRSQLMLVVNQPTKAENEQMAEEAKTLGDNVLASSTYQIDLQICGCLRKVPDGSYMQVSFGFPEGYGPDDAGVSFTVYHYKKDTDGTIIEVEAVPCVITEYGIIATVKSFSPFMICAVTSDSPSIKNAGKMIMASVDGVGGNIVNNIDNSIDNKIDTDKMKRLKSGDSVTYTITKEAGYEIDRVLVNGVDKKADVVDGKLTLDEADLDANNTVVVSFIHDDAAKFIADNNITVVEHSLIVTDKDMIVAYVETDDYITPEPSGTPDGGTNVGLIVTIVVLAVVLVAAAAVAVFIIFRKKGQPEKATAGKGNNGKTNKAQAKSEQKKPTETAANKNAATAVAQRSTAPTPQKPSAAPTTRTAPTTQKPSAAPITRTTPTTQKPSAAPTPRTAPTTQKPSATPITRTTPTPQKPSATPITRTAPTTQKPSAAPTTRTTSTTNRPQNNAQQRPTSAPARPAPQRPPQNGATRNAPTDKK